MDPNYAMAKFRMESKDILRSKQKGCWYYLKYFFFFLSIIQFLIILGLVLFMRYGNAHIGTESRLDSVKGRYENLTVQFDWINYNFSLLKRKYAIVETERQNCTVILAQKIKQLQNLTIPIPKMPPSINNCKDCQMTLERLNMTCFNGKLLAENNKLLKEREFEKFKDNCTKTSSDLATKEHEASSEKEKIQRQKTDLESQLKLLQNSCTSIEQKFSRELENLRSNTDTAITHYHETYQSGRCKLLSDSVNRHIDHAIKNLRQDVNSFVLDNSQVRTTNMRINEDLRQCTQDKAIINEEKNKLTVEKGGLEKQLTEKKDEITRSFSQYMKKAEELDYCRRIQIQSRMPGQRQ